MQVIFTTEETQKLKYENIKMLFRKDLLTSSCT